MTDEQHKWLFAYSERQWVFDCWSSLKQVLMVEPSILNVFIEIKVVIINTNHMTTQKAHLCM